MFNVLLPVVVATPESEPNIDSSAGVTALTNIPLKFWPIVSSRPTILSYFVAIVFAWSSISLSVTPIEESTLSNESSISVASPVLILLRALRLISNRRESEDTLPDKNSLSAILAPCIPCAGSNAASFLATFSDFVMSTPYAFVNGMKSVILPTLVDSEPPKRACCPAAADSAALYTCGVNDSERAVVIVRSALNAGFVAISIVCIIC